MNIVITSYKIESLEELKRNKLRETKYFVTLNLKVSKLGDNHIIPDELIKILNDTQDFYMKKYNKKSDMSVDITSYKLEQVGYPISINFKLREHYLTLNIEISNYNNIFVTNYVNPKELAEVVTATEEFYYKNYLDDK